MADKKETRIPREEKIDRDRGRTCNLLMYLVVVRRSAIEPHGLLYLMEGRGTIVDCEASATSIGLDKFQSLL